jgi:hypothetical protein
VVDGFNEGEHPGELLRLTGGQIDLFGWIVGQIVQFKCRQLGRALDFQLARPLASAPDR